MRGSDRSGWAARWWGVGCGFACLLLGACSSTPTPMSDPIADYAAVISELEGAGSAGPAERRAGVERWKRLVGDFSQSNLEGNVAGVYAEDAFFNDTLKTLEGAEAIEAYLLETAEMLNYGTVEFEDEAISGDDVYVRWKMVYRSKVLSKRQDIVTIGMTHLRFDVDGKVVLHQDFWDSTRGVFEHVPVVGAGIRLVKGRL